MLKLFGPIFFFLKTSSDKTIYEGEMVYFSNNFDVIDAQQFANWLDDTVMHSSNHILRDSINPTLQSLTMSINVLALLSERKIK